MSKKKSKGLGGVITFSGVSFFVVAFLITLTILANGMLKPILQTILGGQKPVLEDSYEKIYTSDYKSKADAVAAGNKLNVKIEEEGAVLLLNEDNALPIAKGSKVSVFGKNSVQLVLGGSGSGGGSSEGASTIFDGLKEGGFEYNPTLKEFYESSASGSGRSDSPALTEGSSSAPTLKTGETPVSAYTNEVKNSFAKYHDAALVVISRLGGESWDLPRTQSDDESRHYLQLDANEYAMLDMVTSRFDKVVVILNVLTSFQCDFIDEYNNTAENKRIDAVLWIGGPGKTGALALGSILNGDVSPSGRTTAIYSRDFRKDPTWQNFGDGTQTTADGSENASLLQVGSPSGYYMVAYEEGVYLGYRYYETRDYVEFEKDAASTWYEDNVVFPFGYGLSYSQFNQSITALTGDLSSGKITVTVKVDWTGGKPGKDVVQLYVSKPYYENGIEKPYVQLVDYAKTETLSADNGSQTFTFTVSAYDLACYDYNDANKDMRTGYVTEHGDYTFFVSKDSHVRENAYDQKTTTLGDDMFFATDPVTGTTVENRYTTNDYDDIQYRLGSVYVGSDIRKGMSRTDFEGTFPKAPTKEERVLSTEEYNGFDELSKLQSKAHNNTKVEGVTQMPEIGNPSSSDIVLHDLLGADGKVAYDNERWAHSGKERPRSTFASFPSVEEAKAIRPEGCSRRLLLDSETEWRFSFSERPEDRPKGFERPEYDVSAWDVVKVPCSWQAMGINTRGKPYGFPYYTNANWPFVARFPANSNSWPRVPPCVPYSVPSCVP